MIKYLVFDFDGTLYDDTKVPLTELNFFEKLKFVEKKLNMPHEELVELACKAYEEYGSTWYALEKFYNIQSIQIGNEFEFPPIEKNLKLRKILESINIKKAIFTNAQLSYINKALKAFGLENLFEKIITLESTKIPPKPQKGAYENLIKVLEVAPNECIFFENTEMNLKEAKLLGIHTVLCYAKNKDKSEFIDYKISSLEDGLLDAINYFNKKIL